MKDQEVRCEDCIEWVETERHLAMGIDGECLKDWKNPVPHSSDWSCSDGRSWEDLYENQIS